MKKTIAQATFILLGIALPPALHAGGNYVQGWGVPHPSGFYGGASLGAANQGEFDDGITKTGKLFGGVRINHMLGAELGYVKIGEAESKTADGRLPANIKSDTSGLYAAAVGYLPVAPNLDLMGKAGIMRWSQENSKSVDMIEQASSSNDSGVSPLFGVGAQYRISENVRIRGEWEHALKAGEEDSDYETDIGLFTLGVSLSTL